MIGELRLPGVYVAADPSAAPRHLATGVPVFLGYTSAMRAATTFPDTWGTAAIKLTAWSDFEPRCGSSPPDGFLADAVRGFFDNGGAVCYVLPLNETLAFADAIASALETLKGTDSVDLVCLPDAARNPAEAIAAQRHTLESITPEHRFAILDSLPDRSLEETVTQWQQLRASADGSRNGGLYFPWVGVAASGGAIRWVPPCGHIAGTIARLDRQIGVHKPPANERLEGVSDLAVNLAAPEQLAHDTHGVVNCLRAVPGRGIRAWGARTTSAESDARSISVRRLVLTMARWFELQMAEVVMEPNGPPLWARVRRQVNDYLYKKFTAGALQGETPPDAYFIKCDEETTPPDARERGELWVRVGIAPVVPGEFIVVRLVHSAAGVQMDATADVGP